MKELKEFINEKLHIGKFKKQQYHPTTRNELKKIITKKLSERSDSDEIINMNDIDTSKITTMKVLFVDLENEPVNIDISEWDVSNVEDMEGMFSGCRYLKTTGDLGKWNISKLKDTSFMFNGCNILRNIGDLSSWNIENIEKMKCMFQGCKNLKTIGDITHWKLPNSNYDVFDISPIKPQPPKRI